MRLQSATRRRHTSRGAAAVEFALVMPILLLLVFGIINYGLVLNDSNNARQGAREAARRAAVQDFGTCAGTTSVKIQCMAKAQVGALSGNAYVSVKAPTWAKGQPLTVCVVITPNNMTKIVPMPKSVSALTTMSIEVDSPAVTAVSAVDTPPSGISYPTGC